MFCLLEFGFAEVDAHKFILMLQMCSLQKHQNKQNAYNYSVLKYKPAYRVYKKYLNQKINIILIKQKNYCVGSEIGNSNIGCI